MNNFLATGGDGFSVFTQCTNPLGGEIDLDVLVDYFEANSPVAPGPQNRITRLPYIQQRWGRLRPPPPR